MWHFFVDKVPCNFVIKEFYYLILTYNKLLFYRKISSFNFTFWFNPPIWKPFAYYFIWWIHMKELQSLIPPTPHPSKKEKKSGEETGFQGIRSNDDPTVISKSQVLYIFMGLLMQNRFAVLSQTKIQKNVNIGWWIRFEVIFSSKIAFHL